MYRGLVLLKFELLVRWKLYKLAKPCIVLTSLHLRCKLRLTTDMLFDTMPSSYARDHVHPLHAV